MPAASAFQTKSDYNTKNVCEKQNKKVKKPINSVAEF